MARKVPYGLFLAFFLFLSISALAVNIPNDPTAYWSLDSSATENTGNVSYTTGTGSPVANGGCYTGGCYCFTGANYFTFNDSKFPTGGVNETYAMWVNLTSYPSDFGFMTHGTDASSSRSIYYAPGTDGKQSMAKFGGGASGSSTTAIALHQWHFIIVSNCAGTLAYYLDGAADGVATLTGLNVVQHAGTIANSLEGAGGMANGCFDELYYYPRCFNASEAYDLYNRTAQHQQWPFSSYTAPAQVYGLGVSGVTNDTALVTFTVNGTIVQVNMTLNGTVVYSTTSFSAFPQQFNLTLLGLQPNTGYNLQVQAWQNTTFKATANTTFTTSANTPLPHTKTTAEAITDFNTTIFLIFIMVMWLVFYVCSFRYPWLATMFLPTALLLGILLAVAMFQWYRQPLLGTFYTLATFGTLGYLGLMFWEKK